MRILIPLAAASVAFIACSQAQTTWDRTHTTPGGATITRSGTAGDGAFTGTKTIYGSNGGTYSNERSFGNGSYENNRTATGRRGATLQQPEIARCIGLFQVRHGYARQWRDLHRRPNGGTWHAHAVVVRRDRARPDLLGFVDAQPPLSPAGRRALQVRAARHCLALDSLLDTLREDHAPQADRILFLAGLGLISPASAQQERSACLRDAQRLCPGLSPGGGRIAACFREHASELSRECKQEIAARRRQGSTDDHRRSPDNAIPQEVPTEHRSTYAERDARLDTTRVELRSDQWPAFPNRPISPICMRPTPTSASGCCSRRQRTPCASRSTACRSWA